MAHLLLSLLGTFQTQLDGKPVTGFQSNKVRALLAYLAVESHQAHERSRLAGLLWPDWPETQARTYVRQSLANLHDILHDRGTAQPFLIATRRTIRFNPESQHTLDISSLKQALVNVVAEQEMPDERVLHGLWEAVSLYRGNFLEGFFLDGCSAYGEWQLFTAEHLRHLVTGALKRLVSGYQALEDDALAQQTAWRWVELEPWSDEAHRQLIQLLALSGEPGAAIAHYERFRQVVQDELGTMPARETQELAERIRAGDLLASRSVPVQSRRAVMRPQSPPFLSVAPSPPSSPVLFVDRETELAELNEHLARACRGQGHTVFVTGEAGEGKTLLMQEFMQRAFDNDPDLIVAMGACEAQTGVGDPYLPFRDLFSLLTGDIEAQWAAGTLSQPHVALLWQVFPVTLKHLMTEGPNLVGTLLPAESLLERVTAHGICAADELVQLQRLVEHRTRQPSFTGSSQQVALFEEATKVLQAIARTHPLLLFIDDLQWADLGSISLLFHLSRRLRGSRLLLVGAYRPEEVALGSSGDSRGHNRGEASPLASVINELRRVEENAIIDLTQADGQAFVRALLDVEPNRLKPEFYAMFGRQSRGHALFTVELLRSLQERGALMRDDEGFWVQGTSLHWESLPSGVETAIADRINRLPPDLRAALAIASVEGERFTAEIVARLMREDQRMMIQRLSSELERRHRLVRARGLRRVNGQRVSTYQFRHILFQHYLYNTLDEAEREYLHEEIARALETFYAGETEGHSSHAAQLAWHFQQAGIGEKAIPYFLQAGVQASRIAANQEAIAHFNHGLELLGSLPMSSARNEQELNLQTNLAVASGQVHGHGSPQAASAYTRALTLAQQTGRHSARYPLLWGLQQYHWVRGDMSTTKEIAQQLFNLTGQTGGKPFAAAHYALASINLACGELTQARDHAAQAVAAYEADPDATDAVVYGEDMGIISLIYLGYTLWCLGYVDQAVQKINTMLERVAQIEHTHSKVFAYVGALGLHCFRREPEKTLAYCEIVLAESQEYHFAQWVAWGLIYQGWTLAVQKGDRTAIDTMRQGIDGFEAVGSLLWGARTRTMIADACAAVGRVEEGLAIVDEALAIAARTGERLFEAEIYRLRGELLLQQQTNGEISSSFTSSSFTNPSINEVESCFLQAIAVARRQQAKSWELRATMSLCRLWQSHGRSTEARQILADLYDWFDEGFDTPDLQDAYTLLHKLHGDDPSAR